MLSNKEKAIVQSAADIASQLHRGQKDKAGVDYFTGHLSAVAKMGNTWQEQVVGYLHDASEDTPNSVEDVLNLLDEKLETPLTEADREELATALRLLNHHLAPTLEELAWHGYGTDCLRSRMSLFKTSMLFAAYWAVWHFPLAGIKGYYHANVVSEGWLYSLNFIVSIFPFVILMNWLYYKTNRNILVAIIFHITAGYFNEIFATHPDSKCIQTVLLLIVSVIIVVKERRLFFNRALE